MQPYRCSPPRTERASVLTVKGRDGLRESRDAPDASRLHINRLKTRSTTGAVGNRSEFLHAPSASLPTACRSRLSGNQVDVARRRRCCQSQCGALLAIEPREFGPRLEGSIITRVAAWLSPAYADHQPCSNSGSHLLPAPPDQLARIVERVASAQLARLSPITVLETKATVSRTPGGIDKRSSLVPSLPSDRWRLLLELRFDGDFRSEAHHAEITALRIPERLQCWIDAAIRHHSRESAVIKAALRKMGKTVGNAGLMKVLQLLATQSNHSSAKASSDADEGYAAASPSVLPVDADDELTDAGEPDTGKAGDNDNLQKRTGIRRSRKRRARRNPLGGMDSIAVGELTNGGNVVDDELKHPPPNRNSASATTTAVVNISAVGSSWCLDVRDTNDDDGPVRADSGIHSASPEQCSTSPSPTALGLVHPLGPSYNGNSVGLFMSKGKGNDRKGLQSLET